jgi:hypothetical protein
MTRAQTRYAAALFLVLLVSVPLVSTAALTSFDAQEHVKLFPSVRGGVVSELWSFLSGFWEKEGSSLDPDGKPVARPAHGSTTDGGSSLDPSGHV